MVPFPALPQDGTTVQGELLPPMVLKQEEEDIRHTHQVVNCALGTLTKDGWLDFFMSTWVPFLCRKKRKICRKTFCDSKSILEKFLRRRRKIPLWWIS